MRIVLAMCCVAAALVSGTPAHASARVVDGQIADWTGTSPLVAGHSVMDGGEFIYQDYIYDDTGAWIGVRAVSGRGFANPYGSYRYPSDEARYRNNSSDIFQFRAALDGDRVHFLVRLNALVAPDTTVVGIAIGDDGTTVKPWGLDSNMSTPGSRHVITLWGTGGAIDGASSDDLEVAVSTEDNAIEASVPVSLTGTAFRAYVATGIWDGDGWMPLALARSRTQASGGNANSPGAFNVAFRGDETSFTPADGWQGLNFWFDYGQASALQVGDISRYHADIDLTAPDSPPLRPTGWQQRLYRSSITVAPHEGFQQTGANGNADDLVDAGRGRGCSLTTQTPSCSAFSLSGPWQPYLLYVPEAGVERATVLLHGGGYPHNFTGLAGVRRDLGEGMRALLIEPYGRGPGGWYTDQGHLDVLEATRTAMSLFPEADPSRTVITGISMGGYGTNRLLATNPDMFAGGVLLSAAPGDIGHEFGGESYMRPHEPGNGNPNELLANNRNHTFVINHGLADAAARYPFIADTAARMDLLGLPYEMWTHPTWQHTTVADVDDWHREAAVFEPLRIDPNPAHVTFTMSETWWRPDISPDLVFDSAYWVSGLRVGDSSLGYASRGTVDAVTHGRGGETLVTEPLSPATAQAPAPHVITGRTRLPGEAIEPANRFEATLTNVREVRFDLGRMGLVRDGLVATITTDGPAVVYLDGERIEYAAAGTYVIS